MSDLIVPHRFRGPSDSGNGGWTAGALATLEADSPDDRSEPWPVLEVTLRQPPPLDAPMQVTCSGHEASASFGGSLIATVRCVETDLTEVDPVDETTAATSAEAYSGHTHHPFPSCFSCGPAREEGDGLRIFPGPVAPGRAAAPWTPHASLAEDWHTYVDESRRVSTAVTWAALDCVGAWAADFGERALVLGRMTARIDTLPVIGEPHVVVGEHRGGEGRKSFTASTLYDADGRVVATAEHVWIAVDPGAFERTSAQPVA